MSALYATGVQAYSGLPAAWLIYWLGDSTGVLLITPLVVGADAVDVLLHLEGADLNLAIRDRGTGFDVERSKLAPGIGLVSMHERAKLVGGDLSIESAPLRGTTIRARVPLSEAVARV